VSTDSSDESASFLLESYAPIERISPTENRLHGMALLPPGAVFGPRKLNSYLLTWIVAGPPDSELILDGQHYRAAPGAFFLLRPGMHDELRFGRSVYSIHAFFHFYFRKPESGWPTPAHWPVRRQLEADSVLPQLFRYLLHVIRLPNCPALPLVRSTLQLMITAFLTGETSMVREPRATFPRLIESALEAINRWVDQDTTERMSVADLAKSLHVHPDHLTRQFRRVIGIGPSEYLMMVRLEQAASLLRDTEQTVETIASLCGFHDQSHFSRTFSRLMGAPPSEFRRSASLRGRAMRPTAQLFHPYLREDDPEAGPRSGIINDIRDRERIGETYARLTSWNEEPFPGEPAMDARGWQTIDLQPWANRTRASGGAGWFGHKAPILFPEGDYRFHGVPFQLAESGLERNGYVLIGRDSEGHCEGMEVFQLPLPKKTRELHLLLAAAWIPAHLVVAMRARPIWGRRPGKLIPIVAVPANEPDIEPDATRVLTDWWPAAQPTRRAESQPVLIGNPERLQLEAVLCQVRLDWWASDNLPSNLRLEAGAVPVMLCGASALVDE